MEFKPYREKLKDPRWQKRRLEILSRDNWTCRCCRETGKTLHVHHKEYRKGLEPWEHSDDDLETLCADCHEAETQTQSDLRESERILVAVLKECEFIIRLYAAEINAADLTELIRRKHFERTGRQL